MILYWYATIMIWRNDSNNIDAASQFPPRSAAWCTAFDRCTIMATQSHDSDQRRPRQMSSRERALPAASGQHEEDRRSQTTLLQTAHGPRTRVHAWPLHGVTGLCSTKLVQGLACLVLCETCFLYVHLTVFAIWRGRQPS